MCDPLFWPVKPHLSVLHDDTGSQIKKTFTSCDLSFLFQLQWSSQPELSGGGGGNEGGSWGGGAGGEGEQASSIRGGRSTHSGEEGVSILI